MTDPVTSGPADDPLHLLNNLIIALTRETELHNRQLNRLDDLIAARVQGIKAEFQARPPDPPWDATDGLGAEVQRTRRAKWYTGVLALLVVVLAAVLLYLAVTMAHEMNRMEDYMYNMGHAGNDDRLIAQDERKVAGTSYLLAMTQQLQALRDDIGAMRLAIGRMDGSIVGMSASMKTMSGNMGTMSRDLATMNYTMGLLRQDTAMMRVSVGGMSNDTRSMGAPFRFMNSFMPW
ncbi:hypothetical protein [uncultured Thiodictyon sp.]|jgi:hypothetical protein|uniref:hypothetical protein n=1 Tax=uncultured Thiodictyon sp. TaxID=1846217 RepID=UPI0025D4ACF4|nr:hypothetical protein [uncultured Thiodictyon sp.]